MKFREPASMIILFLKNLTQVQQLRDLRLMVIIAMTIGLEKQKIQIIPIEEKF